MIPLCNGLFIAETMLILSLVGSGLSFVDYAFCFFRQTAELEADLNKHVVVAGELVDEQLIFLLLDEPSLEILNCLAFCLLVLELSAQLIIQ